MPELLDGQYELTSAALGSGGGFTFGEDCTVEVKALVIGPSEETNGDVKRPRGDGRVFGRDYRSGRTLTFTGQFRPQEDPSVVGDLAPGVLALADEFSAAWDAEEIRTVPGAYSVLRMCRGGRTRWVYGRTRALAPIPGTTRQGYLPWTGQFVTGDHLFYDDTEQSQVIPFIPHSTGGLGPGPLIGPWIASSSSDSSTVVVNGGSRKAWLAWRIDGPIVNPEIIVTDRWSATLGITLAADQWVLVDPSPWNRAVRRNDGAYLGGKFSPASQRLSGMAIPPGSSQVFLRGVDPTQTARLTTYHRDTFASY